MKRALLRFDVSSSIGAGHMARCLALAAALRRCGYATAYAVNDEGVAFLPAAAAADAIAIATKDGVPTASGSYDLAIVDHYGLDAADERALRACSGRIVVVDDIADRLHDADVLIDSAPLQASDRYAALIGSGTMVLLGADYALLRDDFRGRRCLQRPSSSRPSVLVSMGGTDHADATSVVLEGIYSLGAAVDVTVVLGRGAQHHEKVAERLKLLPGPAELLSAVDNMAELVDRHTIAVGAPGVSSLERACLGQPQVLVTTAVNQTTVALGLRRAGAAFCLGLLNEVRPGDIAAAARTLLEDSALRERMARAGRRLVDGMGAARVAAHLAAMPRDRNGNALRARRVRAEDSEALLRWQMHPATRRYSRDPAPPSREDHAKFMSQRLDGQCIMEILARDGSPTCVVRAERQSDPIALEVSITTAPEAQGHGIGQAALRYLDALLPDASLLAYVDPGNTPSLKLFTRAGYREEGRRRLIVRSMGLD